MRRFAVLLVAAAMLTLSFTARRARAGEAGAEESVSKAGREELVARVLAMQKELQRRHKQIDTMHNIILKQQQALEVAKANLRNAQNRRIEAEAELEKAREELARLRADIARLKKDVEVNASIIRQLKEMGVPVNDMIRTTEKPAAHIEGKVLAVRPEVNLVTLSVGALDGVKKGCRFRIYRGERYIGKVEVEKTFDDTSSARILVDWTREPVKENDDASTRVYGKPPPGRPVEREPAAPPITCKVLAVRPEVMLVMLSVGADDGVKKGYRFVVYRGERHVGMVEVESVFDDMSSAKILVEWEKIREKDDASTRMPQDAGGAAPEGRKETPAKEPRELF